MIYVMLAFILAAIIGSSVTVYDFFFKNNGKKMKSSRIDNEKKGAKRATRLEKRNKSLKTGLEDCKSFLKLFCIVRNGRSILNTVSSEEQIDCIHGLRFIGNAWVILTHTGLSYICFSRNLEQAKPLFELRTSQLLFNGKFSVDIFFVISGFLNAYFFFYKFSRCNGNICWIFFYLKRFIRLTPVYMIVLGFYSTLFTYTGTGHIWPTYDTNPACKKNWFWHLLYINNFEESVKECMLWSWYLAADMQFYIISPIFMISLMRWPRFGYFLIIACIAGSCTASFMLTYQYNLTGGFSRFVFHLPNIRHFLIKYWEYFDFVYTKPYARISAYLVGVTLGYCLFKKNIKKHSTRNRKMTLWCGWIVTAIFMWICFYWLYEKEHVMPMDTAVYNGIKYLFFSCGVAWIIYVCFTGQAGFLNSCLSSNVFLPLSRLSYCAYLIHPIVQVRIYLQTEKAMDFNAISLMSLYLYTCVITYPVSFIASVLFEIPILNIFDWLSKKPKDKTSSLTDSSRRTKFSKINKNS